MLILQQKRFRKYIFEMEKSTIYLTDIFECDCEKKKSSFHLMTLLNRKNRRYSAGSNTRGKVQCQGSHFSGLTKFPDFSLTFPVFFDLFSNSIFQYFFNVYCF